MPKTRGLLGRYFFGLTNDHVFHDEGCCFATTEGAMTYARAIARERADDIGAGGFFVVVHDALGREIARMALAGRDPGHPGPT